MKYCFDLNDDDMDEFDISFENVGTVLVLKDGIRVTDDQYKVMLTLSKNGMIGLGTELIRLAHQFEIGRHSHIEPITEGLVVQSMGIFLTPESRELIVACGDETDVDSYIPPELQD